MKNYILLGGQHVEDGKVYSKNQIVPSEFDLVKLFPLKFKAVDTAPAPVIAEGSVETEPEPEEEKETFVATPFEDTPEGCTVLKSSKTNKFHMIDEDGETIIPECTKAKMKKEIASLEFEDEFEESDED